MYMCIGPWIFSVIFGFTPSSITWTLDLLGLGLYVISGQNMELAEGEDVDELGGRYPFEGFRQARRYLGRAPDTRLHVR